MRNTGTFRKQLEKKYKAGSFKEQIKGKHGEILRRDHNLPIKPTQAMLEY